MGLLHDFQLIKNWNPWWLDNYLDFYDESCGILYLSLLSFQSGGVLKNVFWRFTRPLTKESWWTMTFSVKEPRAERLHKVWVHLQI